MPDVDRMPSVAESVDADVPAVLIEGGCGSGKTHELVRRVREAAVAQVGAASGRQGDVLVLCATPLAACDIRARLHHAFGRHDDALSRVHVETARETALDALSGTDAQAFTGRAPRIANDLERVFVDEDMKTCGMRPKRLREMTKFFYRSWTELADDDPGWLLEGEEANTHGLLKQVLSFYRVMLEPEAGNLACAFLRTHASARERLSYARVFADDFQAYNRSSQVLASLLTRESIAVTWDGNAVNRVFDSYPFAKGAEELCEWHTRTEVVRLDGSKRCAESASACDAVLKSQKEPCDPVDTDGTSAAPLHPEARPNMVAAKDFMDEISHAVGMAKDAVEAAGSPKPSKAGSTDAEASEDEGALCAPAEHGGVRVVAAVPNDTWSHNMTGALRDAGLAVDEVAARRTLVGDVRDKRRCTPAMTMAGLRLVACPDDPMAWRAWCGFGDYLTNSMAFMRMRMAAARGEGGFFDLLDAPTKGRDGADDAEQRVASAAAAGKALVRECAGLSGQALLDHIASVASDDRTAHAPESVVELCRPNAGDGSASAMLARADAAQDLPTISGQRVTVLPYDMLCGLSPDTLVVTGFNNGFFPSRAYFDRAKTTIDKQKTVHERDTHRAYALLGKADRELDVTWVSRMPLESAEAINLKVHRITALDGTRVCELTPSVYLRGV